MVEAFFGQLTRKRIRRGTFRSVPESIAAIDESIDEHNKHPKRFIWTKDADMILAKIQRCKEALGTAH